MGWWSTCVMGGDTPLDLQGVLCGAMSINFDYKDGRYHFTRGQVEEYLPRLLVVIEAPREWWSHHKDTAYQVLGHMLMETGAEIPEWLRERIVRAAREDSDWRTRPLDEPDDGSDDPERRASMEAFAAAIKAHVAGTPTHMRQEGLMEKLQEHLRGEPS